MVLCSTLIQYREYIKSYNQNGNIYYLTSKVTILESCSCVADSLKMDNLTYQDGAIQNTATDGKCPQNCNTLGIWLVLIALVIFLIFAMRVPTLLITMR